MPDWLLAWAARWDVDTRGGQMMKLLQVQAYARGPCGQAGGAPVRSLFLPVWA
jgi:hypothetical protein